MPRQSRYKAALAMDEDLARELIAFQDERDEDDDGSEGLLSPVGYSIDTYLLLAIVDALMGVQASVIAAAGVDPPRVPPMPRPDTAIDRVRDELRTDSMHSLIDLFTPRPDDEGEGTSTPSRGFE